MARGSRLFKPGMITAAAIVSFSLMLGACGNNANNNANSSANSSSNASSNSSSNSSSNASSNTSSNSTNANSSSTDTASLPEVKLTWYFPGNFPQPDQDKVFAEVNKLIKEKINATVDFKPIAFGDYEQKMQVVIASGEPYDLAFTSNWLNNYTQNVAKGAFLPLDDLLSKYAPKSYAAIPANFWDATKVNGKIYGYIDYQVSARTPDVLTPKALADKYSFDINSISGKIGPDSLNLLEPYIAAVYKDNPQRYAVTDLNNLSEMFPFEAIGGINTPGVVYYNDDNLKVVNQFESNEMKQYAATMRDWNAKGYMGSKARISKQTDDWSDAKAGKWIIDIGGAYKPGVAVQNSLLGGEPYVDAPAGTPHLTTGGIIATMQAISRTSENPERAMMLLELLNTDQELYNMLNFGIKGQHFDLDADGFKIAGPSAQGYSPNVPWMFASNFLAYVDQGLPKSVWDDTIKFNEDAAPSKLLGFSFDAEPVKAEIAKTTAVYNEYFRGIELGVTDQANYDKFVQKMKDAGADTIIAEMQKQIDAWKASN